MVIMSLEFSRGLNTWMLKKSKPTNRIWESSCHSSGAHWSMGPVTQQAAAAGNGGLFPTQGEMKFSMINSQSCAILFPVIVVKRILIVEDEPELQELLCAYLQDAGYAAAVAGDGAAALDLFRAQSFDLVLLDIMLPKIDGFGVCAQIRRQSQVPILMLTALDGETQQLRGFGLNIDDYVTSPSPYRSCWRKSG